MMAEMEMLENIAAHSIRVCQVATLLTDHLNSNGADLDRNLIQAAALLHDITKTRSLNTSEDHAHTGELHLRNLGYLEVAAIVGQHVRLSGFEAAQKPTEAEVVNYADKRVLHDKVVSLDERMAYILKRYSCSGELGDFRLNKMGQASQAIEEKLFKRLPFSTDEMKDHLFPEDFEKEMAGYQQTIRNFSTMAS